MRIAPLSQDHIPALEAHFRRHFAESGQDGDIIFMPYSPASDQGPQAIDREHFARDLSQPGWRRYWGLFDQGGEIVGHIDVRTSALESMQHRCELGIGIERAFRGQGFGTQLMLKVIEFALAQPALCWLDLRVFGHNTAARALYRSLGFVETANLPDMMRINGQQIDDVWMTLAVDQSAT